MCYLLFSLFLGTVAVLQGGLNRQITRVWGLAGAVALNGVVVAALTLGFAFVCFRYSHLFPQATAPRVSWSTLRWWFVVPGLCGFALITGIPLVISQRGALAVFLGIVVGQMITSLLWDLLVESQSLDVKRLIGASLALIGLLISNWR